MATGCRVRRRISILPIETMPVLANAPYVHEPDTSWLYIVGRVKPGVALAPLQEKLNALLRQIFARKSFTASKHDRSCWRRRMWC